jgi:16S rRNA processing protein RimM
LEGYFEIGHIAKLHGFKGEVSFFLDHSDPDLLGKCSFIFLEMDGIPTPFSIHRLKPMNKGFYVLSFDGIESEAAARTLLKKRGFLPEALLPELDDSTFYDHEVIGFEVFDTSFGPIGIVVSIIDHVANPLLQLDCKGKEVLIPLNVELNKKIDRKKRTLTLTAPEGLLEIYLT